MHCYRYSFHTWYVCSLWQDLSVSTKILSCDLYCDLWPTFEKYTVCHKNFNFRHNYCTVTGTAFILGMCVLCDKTFPSVPKFYIMWPLLWPLTYFWNLSVTKTLTLAITFALLQVELWYLACVFFMTRPFRRYHVVTLTLTFDLLQGQICCRAGDHNSLNLLVYLLWFQRKQRELLLLSFLSVPEQTRI